MKILWFIPSHGDSRYLGSTKGARAATFDFEGEHLRALWAGVGLVRGGAGTALVGNLQQVADRIKESEALGLDYFVMSGYPHLEEAHRFAELVFPLLPLEVQSKLPGHALTGPFGEIMANSFAPSAVAAR